MISILLGLTIFGYLGALVCFGVFFRKGSAWASQVAQGLLALSSAFHLTVIVTLWMEMGRFPFSGIYTSLSSASLLLVFAFLVFGLRYNLKPLGVFFTPIPLVFLVTSSLGYLVGFDDPEVHSWVLPIHIGSNLLGVVGFSLAFVASIAYLIQERLLRTKRVSGVFQRLPAMDVLDVISTRSIVAGFLFLSFGIMSGALWVGNASAKETLSSPPQVLAIVTWLIFGGVLLMRTLFGWRGRKTSLGVFVGFVCVLSVLLGYIARSVESMG